MAAIESESYFVFNVSDCIRLRRLKSIRVQNFDEISQSTAEINLLPVSEKGRRPYCDFTMFSPRHVILLQRPNFFVIRRSKDGGHGVRNLIPGSGLVMAPV